MSREYKRSTAFSYTVDFFNHRSSQSIACGLPFQPTKAHFSPSQIDEHGGVFPRNAWLQTQVK